MTIFPGSGERFCGYEGDLSHGHCRAETYILDVVLSLLLPAVVIGVVAFFAGLLTLVGHYICTKLFHFEHCYGFHQGLEKPVLLFATRKILALRLFVALLAICIIGLTVGAIVVDNSVYQSSKDFTDQTVNFADNLIAGFSTDISTLQQGLQNLSSQLVIPQSSIDSLTKRKDDIQSIINKSHDLEDALLGKFIGEMVVLGLVVVVTALGTVAALWGSTKLVLFYLILLLVASLPLWALLSYGIGAEAVFDDACSEYKLESAGIPAALSYGILSCDSSSFTQLRQQLNSTRTQIANLGTTAATTPILSLLDARFIPLANCAFVPQYTNLVSGDICGDMMDVGTEALLIVIVLSLMFVSFIAAFIAYIFLKQY